MSERPAVLLVEDSPVMRTVAARNLAQYELDLHIAQNGLEAVKAVQQHEFALILMDISMPEMSGIEATYFIRKYTGCRAPIVAVTASEPAATSSTSNAGRSDSSALARRTGSSGRTSASRVPSIARCTTPTLIS